MRRAHVYSPSLKTNKQTKTKPGDLGGKGKVLVMYVLRFLMCDEMICWKLLNGEIRQFVANPGHVLTKHPEKEEICL